MKLYAVRLPVYVIDGIKKEAASQGITASSFLRRAINAYLKELGQKPISSASSN